MSHRESWSRICFSFVIISIIIRSELYSNLMNFRNLPRSRLRDPLMNNLKKKSQNSMLNRTQNEEETYKKKKIYERRLNCILRRACEIVCDFIVRIWCDSFPGPFSPPLSVRRTMRAEKQKRTVKFVKSLNSELRITPYLWLYNEKFKRA